MLNKSKVSVALVKYFKEKGGVLTQQEYALEVDAPVTTQSIKQLFGSWERMEKSIMTERLELGHGLNLDEVMAERNKPAYEAQLAHAARAEAAEETPAVAEPDVAQPVTSKGSTVNTKK